MAFPAFPGYSGPMSKPILVLKGPNCCSAFASLPELSAKGARTAHGQRGEGKERLEQGSSALAALLDETGLGEVEIEREGVRVRVARRVAIEAAIGGMRRKPPANHGPAGGGRRQKGGGSSQHPGAIKSPMVGTAIWRGAGLRTFHRGGHAWLRARRF